MRFSKWHGLGNDFVIIDGFEESINDLRLAEFAVKVCNRHFGVGADGVALILPSAIADFRMRLINSDGSEAEMCGNVIRCVARYMVDKGSITHSKMSVETLAGIIKPEVMTNTPDTVRVDMGEPRLSRGTIPMIGNPNEQAIAVPLQIDDQVFMITAVSMGNPHCIIFVDDLAKVKLEEIGPRVEKHGFFPKKTNVEFVQIIDRANVRMRVWERGAGTTLACGTGASATLVATVLNNKTDRQANIVLDGGTLMIEWAGDNHVYMTGPVARVFNGEYLG